MLEVAQAAGHALDTLFLYHKGAYAALNPPAVDRELCRWSRLAESSGIQCIVCRTALAGTLTDLAPPFRLGGLVDWLAACERSDRVLRLGSLRE